MTYSVWLCFLVILKFTHGQFIIPPIKLEAFSPSGIRVSMEALPDIELFGFHGKVNEAFKQIEPGDFTEDIMTPTNGYFIYDNPNLRINIGDVVYYWIFVQHDQLGYRLDNQNWTVTELKPKESLPSCLASKTIIIGQENICSGSVIFEDDFDDYTLNTGKWIWEQYIPTSPDFEFTIYKKDTSVTALEDNHLMIKPKLQSEDDLQQNWLDLTDGCTQTISARTKCRNRKYLLQNPVISGKIVSITNFSYAEVEIRAKLPSGDWMYPQIYLEDENYQKLVIAYARGNKLLQGNNNVDFGGSLLFGGPIISNKEPDRSSKLSSYRNSQPLSDSFHTYRLRWTPDQVELFLDGDRYGLINGEKFQSSGFASNPPPKTHLVLGVGIGGITDFPDFYQSGYPKPWRNSEREQVKKFYEARDQWLSSWNTGGTLQIEYVRINAI